MKNILKKKLQNKSAVIGILGLGYVGLPLLLRYAEVGYKVIGIDIDQHKVDMLNQGESYIDHINSTRIKILKNNFKATSDYTISANTDALILCVPTPLNKYREPDLSFVKYTVDSVIPCLRKGHVISLESTTYPGTTEEELLPRIESTGLRVGKDVFLVYSPEKKIQLTLISQHNQFLKL